MNVWVRRSPGGAQAQGCASWGSEKRPVVQMRFWEMPGFRGHRSQLPHREDGRPKTGGPSSQWVGGVGTREGNWKGTTGEQEAKCRGGKEPTAGSPSAK